MGSLVDIGGGTIHYAMTTWAGYSSGPTSTEIYQCADKYRTALEGKDTPDNLLIRVSMWARARKLWENYTNNEVKPWVPDVYV